MILYIRCDRPWRGFHCIY